jgi:hypothetical protein
MAKGKLRVARSLRFPATLDNRVIQRATEAGRSISAQYEFYADQGEKLDRLLQAIRAKGEAVPQEVRNFG